MTEMFALDLEGYDPDENPLFGLSFYRDLMRHDIEPGTRGSAPKRRGRFAHKHVTGKDHKATGGGRELINLASRKVIVRLTRGEKDCIDRLNAGTPGRDAEIVRTFLGKLAAGTVSFERWERPNRELAHKRHTIYLVEDEADKLLPVRGLATRALVEELRLHERERIGDIDRVWRATTAAHIEAGGTLLTPA